MWMSGWALIPQKVVPLLIRCIDDPEIDIEPWDYKLSEGFMDGHLEGSDLILLWELIRPVESSALLWSRVYIDAPDGYEKIASISFEAMSTFAVLDDDFIDELANRWRDESPPSTCATFLEIDHLIDIIQRLRLLARIAIKLFNRSELLMIWLS